MPDDKRSCLMTGIASDETTVEGRWVSETGRVVADHACKRIENLTSSYLSQTAQDGSGWFTLFRDPVDQRLWERDFPQSHLHGGGPPRLRFVLLEEVRHRYRLK